MRRAARCFTAPDSSRSRHAITGRKSRARAIRRRRRNCCGRFSGREGRGRMTYTLYGALASPYSMKMRAVMRYRRIPHIWRQMEVGDDGIFMNVKAPVIPVLQYPDGTWKNDSTPLIFDLETRHFERSVVPDDPGMGFLAYLLEDFADEWGTKAMFHYRWFRERDQKQMSEWIVFDRLQGKGRINVMQLS